MKIRYPIETGIFLGLLTLLNLPLSEGWRSHFILLPTALERGEVWRLLTFPWVHISLYHLLLDGSAFLLLYQSLRCSVGRRLQHLFLTTILSGIGPILLDPRIQTLGLGGLSGVAHGLMLIGGWEAAAEPDKKTKWLGVLLFGATLAKTIFEQMSGQVLLAEYHLGNVGTPVAACHFGGVVGAVVSMVVQRLGQKAGGREGTREVIGGHATMARNEG